MTEATSPAVARFIAYFGELGPRWGLPKDACRLHALLYVVARPMNEAAMKEALALNAQSLAEALAFLRDYKMATPSEDKVWQTSAEPLDLLLKGLDERRRRELGPALDTLRECKREAETEGPAKRVIARQIAKMLELTEGLAALDAQAQRISPRLLRGLMGVSGRAARFMNNSFPGKRRPDHG